MENRGHLKEKQRYKPQKKKKDKTGRTWLKVVAVTTTGWIRSDLVRK